MGVQLAKYIFKASPCESGGLELLGPEALTNATRSNDSKAFGRKNSATREDAIFSVRESSKSLARDYDTEPRRNAMRRVTPLKSTLCVSAKYQYCDEHMNGQTAPVRCPANEVEKSWRGGEVPPPCEADTNLAKSAFPRMQVWRLGLF
jgi:hypothetical protein